jgi:aryl-alcohol dehydrogenase-like predicted oxidoreductase
MNYRALGRTGVQVSQLCFGTMPFGGDANEADSAQMYRAGRDAGINFFDTADQYSKGRSEEILGALMRGHRDELIVATKCYSPSGSDINARGGSRRHIRRALEASLKRLQTDRVEILYLHQYDALTPMEESMRALEDLVRAGSVLYPALSNHPAWLTQQALDAQERHRTAPRAAGCFRASTHARTRQPGGSRRTRCTKTATAKSGCTKWQRSSRRSPANAAFTR